MRVLLLLAAALTCAAQTETTFQSLDEYTGPFQRFMVRVCNPTAQTAHQTYADFSAVAAHWNLSLASNVELLRSGDADSAMSWQRKALFAAEIGGWVTTTLLASNVIKVREKAFPAATGVFSAALRYTTTVIKAPAFELPANPRPPLVILTPGDCGEYTVYGIKR